MQPNPAPPVLVGDNSSTGRKIAVPGVATAITVLVVIALQVIRAPLTSEQYALGSGALTGLLIAALDIVLPDRFLA